MSVIQQNTISTNSITEATSANGVSIDGLKIKDYSLMYGSNIGLTVSSDGYVTKPNQPAFCVTASWASTSFGGNALINFDTNTTISTPPHYFNTSTSTFTAPVAGKYQFNVHLYTYNNHSFQSVLTINGSYPTYNNDVLSMTQNLTSGTHEVSGSIIYYLNANDTVQLRVRSGQNAQIYGKHSHLSGHLIG